MSYYIPAHCDRCPLKRHRQPCPARWESCGEACELAGSGQFRHAIVAASTVGPTAAQVAAFQSAVATAVASHPSTAGPFGFEGTSDGRIQIGIVTPGLYRGGAEIWMLSLLEHTDSARLDWRGVAVLYPEQTEPTMYRALKSRARVGFGPTALDELYRAVDVVLVWGVTAAEQRLPRPPRRCKVVLVSHGSGPWTARVFSQYARADAYAAVSRQALLPVPEAVRPDTTVIGNCFEPERVAASPGARAALRGEWGVRPGEAVLGYLGRLSNEKNPGALIAAVEADASVRGVFVGTGAMLSDLQARTSTSPAHDRIVFHGAVELPGDALSAFDAMVLPSHEEGCAIVVLEAWAAGCPVIATPVGIAPEWPELVRTIPLGPSGAAIAEALAADRADPAGTRARVERAKEVAQAQFSPAAFGAAWTELVARVNTAPPTKKTPPWLADTAYVQTSVTPSPAEVAAERDIIARVNACPYRGCRVSCTSAKCAAGKGDQGEGNVATMSHCRVCVAGS